MTEKRQTSQGYIIRILQHFATKLWNITNFVMLFQTCLDQNLVYNANVHCKGTRLFNLVPRACDPWEGNEGSGIIRFREESDWPLK
jgi:hypothetical protein